MNSAIDPPSSEGGAARWSWDVASGQVTWSEELHGLFGLPPGSFAGTYDAYVALVHPEDRALFQAIIARTLEGEDEYVISHRVVWPDGSVHWIDGQGRLVRTSDGRPLRLDGVVLRAGARAQAAAKLEHLTRLQSVATAVTKELLRVRSDGEAFAHACRIAVEHGRFRFAWVGLLRPDGRVEPAARAGSEEAYLDEVTVTSDAAVPLGRGPVGTSIREGRAVVVNDVDHDPIFAPWREPALRHGFHGCASVPLRRGGKVIGALAIYSAEAQRFDASQIDLLVALSEDIGFTLDAIDADSKRRAAEEALRRSEERFRALFELAADGIFLVDGSGRIADVNAAACTITGFSQRELQALRFSDLFLAEGADLSRPAEERRLRRADGTILDVELSATTLGDGGLQATVRDVTPRKRVQQQLILADRLVSLGRLAAGVAHEVNNPLTYVMINLQRIDTLSARGEASASVLDEIRAAAAEALDGADRVRGVVRALGTFGKDDDTPATGVDLHRVLDTAVRLAENRARHRGRLVKEYAAKAAVRGNELRLGQVFVNLLVNAADALRDGPPEENEIRVRTYDQGDAVVVEVSDNGVGIPPENLGRIFDPFFTTKEVGEGAGLGLAIAHSIVTAFGGSISVESAEGRGATFRVKLLADTGAAQPKRPSDAAVERRARVLIVDDEPRLARVLAGLLQQQHDVTIATSGREALALCDKTEFDCIVCDLMMPDVSGMDLHATLARDGRGLHERVVFMTGGTFTARAREFAATLPNPLLEKPFTPENLGRAVAAVIARTSVSRKPG